MSKTFQGQDQTSQASRAADGSSERHDGRSCTVVHVITRLAAGGAPRQVLQLAKRQANHARVIVVHGSLGQDELDMSYLVAGTNVELVHFPYLRRQPALSDFGALFRLRSLLRSLAPDVVHTHTSKAGLLGRIAGWSLRSAERPALVHTVHNLVVQDYFRPLTAWLYLLAERLVSYLPVTLIVPSKAMQQEIVRIGLGRAHRIQVIPPGLTPLLSSQAIPSAVTARSAARQALELPEDGLLVALVGRLVPIKRVDRFLRIATEVAREHPDVDFVIAGDGELRSELERSGPARRLGHRLHWLGHREDITPLYAAIDLLASTSDSESTGMVLVESQAVGVPVVTTRTGGTDEVVRDGITGFVIPRADEAAFAAAVGRLLSDEELRYAFVRAGQEFAADRFSLDREVERVMQVYRSGLASSFARRSVVVS